MRIACVLGTRPEAIKLAPVVRALRARPGVEVELISTGQHRALLDAALDSFGLAADADLGLMRPGQTPAALTASALDALAPRLVASRPNWVVVQGDTSTAFAAALAAFHAGVRVAHVEAGLRTHDPWAPWPEEMNRRLIGALAARHFAPTQGAADNLRREGVPAGAILVTGNTGVDALHMTLERVGRDASLEARFAFLDPARRLVLFTGHRRESLDGGLARVARGLARLAARGDVEIVVALHLNPRAAAPMRAALGDDPAVHLLPPLDHPAFVWLMRRAHLIVTDSGGVQEEAPSLGRPVLVARERSDRPEAIAAGTARLVGTDPERLVAEAARLLDDGAAWAEMARAVNPYGDGRAAERIADSLCGDSPSGGG
jgi:UDP-N-acetylglucosamine 2-epimerase (non-hydrolysing)